MRVAGLGTVCRRTALCGLAALLAACVTPPRPAPGQAYWSGRLAVQVNGPAAQAFSASFELTGTPASGELTLSGPLGNTLATVRWAPGVAELQQGTQQLRRNSLDELTTELSGTALPVTALFAWLNGQPAAAGGWTADLSRQPEGRITARRTEPAPSAELRIVFQP